MRRRPAVVERAQGMFAGFVGDELDEGVCGRRRRPAGALGPRRAIETQAALDDPATATETYEGFTRPVQPSSGGRRSVPTAPICWCDRWVCTRATGQVESGTTPAGDEHHVDDAMALRSSSASATARARPTGRSSLDREVEAPTSSRTIAAPSLPSADLERARDSTPRSGARVQSRACQVQMQASLPSGSASTQNAGPRASERSVPPAASAAAIRRAATSCGTVTSTWMRLRCGRGASICWNPSAESTAVGVDAGVVAVGLVAEHRLPERFDGGDLERVDRDPRVG